MTKITPTLTAIALAFSTPLMAAEDAPTPDTAQADEVLPTRGDDISKYRDAGAWKIRQNATRGNCFASYRSDQGAIVQFGFTKSEKVGYLGLFSQAASDTADKQEIAVLANGNIYVGEAMGVGVSLKDGYDGGYILINNPDFVSDIEQSQELVAFPETQQSYIVDMSGAKNAVYEVRECTTKLQAEAE